MKKVVDKEKKKEKKKIMTFIVATNVIASRPPERRLTGAPNTRANKESTCKVYNRFALEAGNTFA